MKTHMRQEIEEIPQAAARLLDRAAADLTQAGRLLRDKDPAFLATIARGSSDHAATFIKYAIELTAGRPVASLGPSLASIYGARLKLDTGAVLTISQSGKSPDIIAMTQAATASGALTLALTNTVPSPVAAAARHTVDISAGPEISVVSTKSFVSAVISGLSILAEWTLDDRLGAAVRELPRQLDDAVKLDWSELAEMSGAHSLYMLGRGPALSIANEAALIFKETSHAHAEAYSAAELLHGPVALVERRFPVIIFAARDAAEASVAEVADNLTAQGALVFITSEKARKAIPLPSVATGHPLTDALALIAPFYGFVEAWARANSFTPDTPAGLAKVTETV